MCTMNTFFHNKCFLLLLTFIIFLALCVVLERATLPETTDAMRREAIAINTDNIPPKPFVYDGCTFFVDSFFTSDFTQSCLRHDMAYWRGGTDEERKVADTKLKAEIQKEGLFGNIVAYPAYLAVRLFGDSFLTRSVNAHWGFGWE